MRTFQFVSATAALTTPCLLRGPGFAPSPPGRPRARPASRPPGQPRGATSALPPRFPVRSANPARRHVVPSGGEGAESSGPHAGQEEGKQGPRRSHSLGPRGRRRPRSRRGKEGGGDVGARGGRGARSEPPPAPALGSPALRDRSRRCPRVDSRGGWRGQGRRDLG